MLDIERFRHRSGATGASLLLVATSVALISCDGTLPILDPNAPQVGLELIATGLGLPTALAVANDGSGRLFVCTVDGKIRVFTANGVLLPTAFLDISDTIVHADANDERGLLGMAFHPDYANNGRLFLYYSAPAGDDVPDGFDHESHLSEFHVSQFNSNQAAPNSERVILRIPQPDKRHNGGQLAFGPKDHFLYISVGDGGDAGDSGPGHTDEIGNGQDRTNILGTILRIDVDGDEPYEIPVDNPFITSTTAAREIYAFGFRNPWRFSFDVTDDDEVRLFAGDVGQNLIEEVDLVEAGGNYGWRVREGTSCFNVDDFNSPLDSCPDTDDRDQPLIDPILKYPHVDPSGLAFGSSVIGGYVYRGSALPEFAGSYIFGDYSASSGQSADGKLFVATEDANGDWSGEELLVATSLTGRINRLVTAFGRDEDGELYVLVTGAFGGQVYKIVPPPAQ